MNFFSRSALLLLTLTGFIFSSGQLLYSQEMEDSVEVYLIDSYVTPETPHRFILSFFTSEAAISKVLIDDKDEFQVSESLTDNHKIEIDVTDLRFINDVVPFFIIVEDSAGNESYSERYDFELPYDSKVEGGSDFLTLCLFGGVVFGLPAPVYVQMNGESYFSLAKEIPVVFLRSTGLGYPMGYFSAEYAHIFNAPVRNFFRIGYKHIIEIPALEYVAPGLNGFTNFKGFNGISPEVSIGLYKFFNVFTFYTRYRFNAKPGEADSEFHEISIGLYSGFFAIYL